MTLQSSWRKKKEYVGPSLNEKKNMIVGVTQMWEAMCKKVRSCIEDFLQILDNYVIMR